MKQCYSFSIRGYWSCERLRLLEGCRLHMILNKALNTFAPTSTHLKKCSQLITLCLLFKAWARAGLKQGGRIRCPLKSPLGPVSWDPQALPQTLTQTLSVGDAGGTEVRGVVDSPPGTHKLRKLSGGTWSPGNGMSHILHHLALSEPWPYNMQTLPAQWIRGVWELLWSGQRR